jgi:hypothetical protein
VKDMSIRGNRLPSLLVVNYPTISKQDFEWIQNIRREHDRLNYQAIDPHFTLVFPVFDIDSPAQRLRQREQLVSHVSESIRDMEAFEFAIRCAVLSNDTFSRYTHVFLVPDEGHTRSLNSTTGYTRELLRANFDWIFHLFLILASAIPLMLIVVNSWWID